MRWRLVAGMVVAFATPLLLAIGLTARSDPQAPTAVRAAPVPRAPAPAVPFAGTTSQHERIGFRVAADGRTIDTLTVTYAASCDGAIEFELDDRLYAPIAVRSDGTFAQRLGERITLRGRIVGDAASGTFEVRMTYGVLTCTSPAVRWTARRS